MVDINGFIGLRSLLDQHRIALSPDGRLVAYVVVDPGKVQANDSKYTSNPLFAGAQLWITDVNSGQTWIPIVEGRSWSPCWSPNGSKVAFYSDEDGTIRLSLWSEKTQETKVIGNEDLYGSNLQDLNRLWLDDDHLCIPLVARGQSNKGHQVDETSQTQFCSCTAEVLYWQRKEDHIANENIPKAKMDMGIIDINTGQMKRIMLGLPQIELFPAPDGKHLAVHSGEGAIRLGEFKYLSSLYVVEVDSTMAPLCVVEGMNYNSIGFVRHHPAWSPDGRTLAYIHDTKVHLWCAETRKTKTICPTSPGSLKEVTLLWTPDGKAILARKSGRWILLGLDGGETLLATPAGKNVRGFLRRFSEDYIWSPDGVTCIAWARDESTKNHGFWQIPLDGSPAQLLTEEQRSFYATPFWHLGGSLADVSAAGDRVVFAAESAKSPRELLLTDHTFKSSRQITNINPCLPKVELGTERLINWVDGNGQQQRGMLLAPPHKAGDKLPVVVSIYPRPCVPESTKFQTWSMATASAIVPPQLLIAAGYAIFVPDLKPQGQDFVAALRVDMALAMRALLDLGIIDPARMAVIGQSFGGYAVNCIITQTNMFKVAVSSAGMGNPSTFFGEFSVKNGAINGFGCQHVETGQLGIGLPWENPLGYLTNSPLFMLDKVQTPLLLIGGGKDDMYQPQEMLVGLERLGKPVQCVRYGGEDHVPADFSLENQRDVAVRVLSWLDKYLA